MYDPITLVRVFVHLIMILSAMAAPPVHTIPASRADVPRATIGSGPAYRIWGQATWYNYNLGQAAAGPKLRAMLGATWRGKLVTVRYGTKHVTVVLTDWCACSSTRIIDLDQRDFATLAWSGLGVIQVSVTH